MRKRNVKVKGVEKKRFSKNCLSIKQSFLFSYTFCFTNGGKKCCFISLISNEKKKGNELFVIFSLVTLSKEKEEKIQRELRKQ